MTGQAVGRIRDALEEHGCRPYGDGRRFRARCPVHESRGLTLSVWQGRTGAVIKCFAACDNSDVLATLGLSWADAFDEPLSRPDNWKLIPVRKPATATDRLVATFTRAVNIINLRSELEAGPKREPLTSDQRVQRADEGCREDADNHYWRTLARYAALACDEHYVRQAYSTPQHKRTQEQRVVLLTRQEDRELAG